MIGQIDILQLSSANLNYSCINKLAEAALFPLVNPLLVGNLQYMLILGGPSQANHRKNKGGQLPHVQTKPQKMGYPSEGWSVMI